MKRALSIIGIAALAAVTMANSGCDGKSGVDDNKTALQEQSETEKNQQHLFRVQPPPKISWSLERDNLTKRTKLQNDRAINFYMYVFIEGVAAPLGYYQVNKVSSVDSQLTNTSQIVPTGHNYETQVIPSPAEDGSYGTNGAGVFGFTPEDIYIEHNLKYIVSTVPLTFAQPVVKLAIVNTNEAREMLEKSKAAMK